MLIYRSRINEERELVKSLISMKNVLKDHGIVVITQGTTHNSLKPENRIEVVVNNNKAIMENLPPHSQSLVYRYDEAEAEQDGIVITTMYRQGFMDGVKSTKLITRYGIIHKFLHKWLPQ